LLEAYGIGVFPQLLLDAEKGDKPKGAPKLRQGRSLPKKAPKNAEPIDVVMTIGSQRKECSVLGIEVSNMAFTGPGLPIAGISRKPTPRWQSYRDPQQ